MSCAILITGIELIDTEDRNCPRITIERNGKEFEFDLNKTNAKNLKELGIKTPKEVIGKKIYFKKALVRNPKTNQEVEGLRICRIE